MKLISEVYETFPPGKSSDCHAKVIYNLLVMSLKYAKSSSQLYDSPPVQMYSYIVFLQPSVFRCGIRLEGFCIDTLHDLSTFIFVQTVS